METINLKINGREYDIPKNVTVLEACRIAGVEIPTLCYLKDINEIGACRMCVVEIKGARSLMAACVYPVDQLRPGTEIITNSPALIDARRKTLELILSNHNRSCLSCVRSGSCELQQLCQDTALRTKVFTTALRPNPRSTILPSI